MTKGRRLIMMILSALMKMLLWTLPGATLRTRDNPEANTPYSRLLSDMSNLQTNLAQESSFECGRVYIHGDFQVLSEPFLRSLVTAQQPTAISSAAALAEVLSQTPTEAEDSIRTLLRGFIRVHRVLSEAAYVVPVPALPEPAKANRDEKVLIVHKASRIAASDKSDVNSSSLLEWDSRHKHLKAVQEHLIRASIGLGAPRTEKASEDELFLYGSRRPMAFLEKHCILEENPQTDAPTSDGIEQRKKDRQWRIMLAFLTPKTK